MGLINSLGAPSTRPCESCSNKPSLCTRIFYLLLPSICHRQWSHLPLLTKDRVSCFLRTGIDGIYLYASESCSRLAALMTCVVLGDIIPDWHVKIIEWRVSLRLFADLFAVASPMGMNVRVTNARIPDILTCLVYSHRVWFWSQLTFNVEASCLDSF